MKPKTLLFIATISTLIFTGCQNNDLSAENQSLKQQITNLQQKIAELEQQNNKLNDSNKNETVSSTVETTSQNNDNSQIAGNNASVANTDSITTVYTTEELSTMVDEFIVSVGSATPDINNSGNLDQFFSLKREADKIEHTLENYENSLEDQYRVGTISRDEYRNLDKEIEQLEELLDSAFDRLEIAYGIDD